VAYIHNPLLIKMQSNIKVALLDDHVLLRTALASLINSFGNYTVIWQGDSGIDLIDNFKKQLIPDVVILDLNMPKMNGFEASKWLQSNSPQIAVLMLTMYDSELTLIQLLKAGVKGFLKKDVHPSELKFALQSVVETGYYYSNHTTGKLVNLFRTTPDNAMAVYRSILSDQELLFLKYACSDQTYKEIAHLMKLNPRTVDSLRDQLFVKLDVKSRVALAMVAIKHGIVTL
jgi:two-component system invasion response regulator UvrY